MSFIVLHGALGSRHQFETLLKEFGDAEFIEFPGHGTTPDSDMPWTIDLFANVLEERLGERKNVDVFGYSMGGYVALTLALRRPELFRRIVTLGTKLHWTPESAEKESSRLNPGVIETKVPAFATDLARRHGAERWQNVLGRTAELMIDLGLSPRLTPHNISTLSVNVQYMLGDADEMVTLDETLAFRFATPQSNLAILPGTRHPIEKVRPELLSTVLRDAFQR